MLAKPYVELGRERLVVFEHGRLKHYVPLEAVVSMQRGFNCTRLTLRNGMEIRVGSLGFLSSTEVDRFRSELSGRIGRAADD